MSTAHDPTADERHRALIVEDDPAIGKLVEKLLKRQQIDVDVATDGRTAMEKLRSAPYSVVVLDLMVPEVNGFEIIEYLKRENVTTPVAVVSAVSQQALTKLDLDVVKLVISKPFDVDEFTKAIVALCREPATPTN
ncbi:MAG: response regulator [Acidobacteria bacterium]|nr:response regulator [Acidobacteriota bacterium]MBV9478013.1 response regulator [Acidobacteriota bacterium]